MKTLVTLAFVVLVTASWSSLAAGLSDEGSDAWAQRNRTEAVVEDHIANHPVTNSETIIINNHTIEVEPTNNGWYAGGAIGAARSEITYLTSRTIPGEDWYDEYNSHPNQSGKGHSNSSPGHTKGGSSGSYPPRKVTKEQNSDETELAFRLYAGYESLFSILGADIGWELGYANLGDPGDTEVDAIDLTATGRIGVTETWAVLVRGGLAYWDAESDGTDGVAAIGITKDIGNLRARLEVARYWNVENDDIDAIFLGAAHRF